MTSDLPLNYKLVLKMSNGINVEVVKEPAQIHSLCAPKTASLASVFVLKIMFVKMEYALMLCSVLCMIHLLTTPKIVQIRMKFGKNAVGVKELVKIQIQFVPNNVAHLGKSTCQKRLHWYHKKLNSTQNTDPPCPPNEKFVACGTACEPSCDTPSPKSCTEKCILNVCQCKTGFVRNSNGDCIKEFECGLSQEITCANVDCISGMVCIMEQVQCNKTHCPAKPTCVPPGKTCAETTCPVNTTCQNIQCFAPPCNAICVPNDEGNDTFIPSKCATMRCMANTVCAEVDGNAQCIPILSDPVPKDCATMLCVANSVCKLVNGTAQCVPIEEDGDVPPGMFKKNVSKYWVVQ
uniref:TIL domain-containing protein n=1 Tax=Acrobeloides nanus TaxID=290746 RepID=A0A914CSB2_9BILA